MLGILGGISESGKQIDFALSQTHLTPKWRLFKQLGIILFDEQLPGVNLKTKIINVNIIKCTKMLKF